MVRNGGNDEKAARVMKKHRNYPRRVQPNSIPQISNRLRLLHAAVSRRQPELASCTEFARFVGLSRNAWWNYVKGHGRISVDAAMRLYERLGVSLDWIYENDTRHMPWELMSEIRLIAEEAANDDTADQKNGAA